MLKMEFRNGKTALLTLWRSAHRKFYDFYCNRYSSAYESTSGFNLLQNTNQISDASGPVIRMFLSRQTVAIFSPSSVRECCKFPSFAIRLAYCIASADIFRFNLNERAPCVCRYALWAFNASISNTAQKRIRYRINI